MTESDQGLVMKPLEGDETIQDTVLEDTKSVKFGEISSGEM